MFVLMIVTKYHHLWIEQFIKSYCSLLINILVRYLLLTRAEIAKEDSMETNERASVSGGGDAGSSSNPKNARMSSFDSVEPADPKGTSMPDVV